MEKKKKLSLCLHCTIRRKISSFSQSKTASVDIFEMTLEAWCCMLHKANTRVLMVLAVTLAESPRSGSEVQLKATHLSIGLWRNDDQSSRILMHWFRVLSKMALSMCLFSPLTLVVPSSPPFFLIPAPSLFLLGKIFWLEKSSVAAA